MRWLWYKYEKKWENSNSWLYDDSYSQDEKLFIAVQWLLCEMTEKWMWDDYEKAVKCVQN